MRKVDVCILGAGPGGLSAAMHLHHANIDCLVLEKEEFPRDKVCGDALSGKVLNELRRIDPRLITELASSPNALGSKGVTFIAPNGKALKVPFAQKEGATHYPGYISKRFDFDQLLFEKAKTMGRISIQERSMIRSAKRSQDGFVLEVSGSETIEAKFVIDGAGAHSPFSRHVAGLDMDPKHHCAGVRGYYEGVKGLDTEGFIELHFVKEALPGYFWIFPLPNGQANVGLGIRTDLVSKRRVNVKALLARVIETAPGIKERFEQAELLGNIKGFPLPLGSKRRRISGNGCLLVGDAAHLIDPFTGEGISNAMISGRHAAQVYAEGIREGDLSAKRLREYDERVFKRLGQELRLSSRLQRLAQKPRLFDLVVNKATRNKELQRTISSMFDDIDLREQLRKPSFYYKVLFG